MFHTFQIVNKNKLIRLCERAGWSVPLLFACNKVGFSGDEAYKRRSVLDRELILISALSPFYILIYMF